MRVKVYAEELVKIKYLINQLIMIIIGGERGIRTLGTVEAVRTLSRRVP